MASPTLLQDSFVRMVRDKSRDQLGKNECWNLVDYIPNTLGAPLRKRGGWEYFGATLNSLDAAASNPGKVAYAPFQAGAQVVAVDDGGKLFDLTNGADRGDTQVPQGPMVFYRDLLIIPPTTGFGDGIPEKYTGSGAPADLGGSPPAIKGSVLAVYKDRLVLGASREGSEDGRVFFSGAGNPESWDTTNRWIDTRDRVVGLAPLRNALIVFHDGSVERIRGDIPPGSAAANMVLEPLFNEVGLCDPDAFAVSDEHAFWADENGVYQTDGASLTDLTIQGGISQFYREQFASVGTSGTVALGTWRGYLFLSLLGSSSAFVDCLVCEIRSRSWFRMSHILAYNFAARFGSTDELYFSNRDTSSKQVGKLSGLFSPASGVKNDADGDAVAPIVETGMYDLGGRGKKRVRNLYVGYDLRDAATDNPTLAVSYLTSPEATSYTALSSLSESSAYLRSRVPVARQVNQIAFKIAQANPSSDTRLYGLEIEAHPQEGSRR